jgi:hypothetical protein
MFWKKKESTNPMPAEDVSYTAATPSAAREEISSDISPEIIAVITAAIAAMTGSGAAGANGLFIRKISRIHGEKVTWSNAGLMECIDSRKF